MTDEATQDPRATSIVLVRIVEWGAWLPRYPDPALSQIKLAEGVTGFEAFNDERLVNLDVMNTNQRHHFTMEDSEGKQHNVEHVYYAFQAALTSIGEEMPEGPSKDRVNVNSLVMPAHGARINHKGQG